MAIAKPPAGASNGELVRWTFEVLDAHDVAALRTMWTEATVERLPSGTVRGADGMAAYFEPSSPRCPTCACASSRSPRTARTSSCTGR